MLSTERLILKTPEWSDLNRYFEIHSDPKTNLFNPFGPIKDLMTDENKLAGILDHWEQYGFGPWKISEKENPNYMIGLGGLDYRKYDEALKLNLGYRFDSKYWGKGYATELAKEAISFGLTALNKKEIFGLVRPKHLASGRVLEKCGLKMYGQLDDVPNQEKSLVYKITRDNNERGCSFKCV